MGVGYFFFEKRKALRLDAFIDRKSYYIRPPTSRPLQAHATPLRTTGPCVCRDSVEQHGDIGSLSIKDGGVALLLNLLKL
jgi:hypothetical protein